MPVSRADLTDLAECAFRATGVAPQDARAAAKGLVLAEMMGITTHGIRRVSSYAKRLRSGGIDPHAQISVEHVSSGLLRLDGGNGLGPAVAMRALDAVQDAARDTGIAAVFCRNSNHIGALSPYLWLTAEAGLACIMTTNATPMMAPTGGRKARLGNNPLGFGFPGVDGAHVLLDIAMSVSSRSRIRDAAAAGKPIPEGWATDENGQTTTDAAAAMAGLLLPIGGHKGYGLALCLDMLAGVFSGAAFLSGIVSLGDQPDAAQNLGQTIIVIDFARMMPKDEAKRRMTQVAKVLNCTPRSDTDMPVRLPGERAIASLRRCEADGIEVPNVVLTDLRALAAGAS